MIDEYDLDELKFYKALYVAKNHVKSRLGYTTSSHNRLLYFKDILEYNVKKDMSKESLKLMSLYNDTFLKSMHKYEYVDPLLKWATENDKTLAICTDMVCDIQMKKLVALGVSSYFSIITTSEEVGYEKPHPYIFEDVYKKCAKNTLVFDKNQYIFIGDNEEKDIDGAQRFGFKSLDVEELL